MSSRPSIWEKCKTRIASPLFRNFRERLKAVARLPKVVEAVAKLGGFGTFDVKTGEPITSDKRSSGYQVSFCTTTTEDPTHANYLTDSAFDATVEEMARQTGSMPEVGVYKGGHEISFFVRTKRKVMQLMRWHNQESSFSWRRKRDYDAANERDGNMSKGKKSRLFKLQFLRNVFFNRKENKV